MEKIADILAWPAVIVLIALVVIFTFRAEIAALIGRTKKVSKAGIETFESQPAQPADERKGVEEFFRTYDNPLLLEAEELIRNDLEERKIEAPADREKALVRALASSNLILHFERVYGIIWASQLALLRVLNTRDDGVEASELAPFYEAAKSEYPALYETYPFDRWLGFLQSFNLALQREARIFITVAGREFLKYLVAAGKWGPYHG